VAIRELALQIKQRFKAPQFDYLMLFSYQKYKAIVVKKIA
jgi:hypothetical protein